ncbi:NAD(+)/NADH kinase, partial [Vibrio parahaemolyticus]|nr:NAD(+)/NADH kinase [Vibrio parahaemolyticus]
MKNPCNVIAIIGKPRDQQAIQTHKELYEWLTSEGYKVFIDDRLAAILDEIPQNHFASLVELGKNADLAIVVGGDGNMLGAARILSRFDVPVIGVNRGNLGFLTDLNPDDFQAALKAVLAGEYIEEERFLLEAEVHRHGQIKSHN